MFVPAVNAQTSAANWAPIPNHSSGENVARESATLNGAPTTTGLAGSIFCSSMVARPAIPRVPAAVLKNAVRIRRGSTRVPWSVSSESRIGIVGAPTPAPMSSSEADGSAHPARITWAASRNKISASSVSVRADVRSVRASQACTTSKNSPQPLGAGIPAASHTA